MRTLLRDLMAFPGARAAALFQHGGWDESLLHDSQAAPAPERTQASVDSQSVGCVSCHGTTDAASMHASGTVHVGCAFCHGGDPTVMRAWICW